MYHIYIESILIILLEILGCKMFIETFAKRRIYRINSINYILLVGLILQDFCIALILSNSFLFKSIIVIFINSLFMFLYFKIRFIKSVILVLLYQGILIAIDSLVLAFIQIYYPANISMSFTQSDLVVVMGKMILIFFIMVIKRIYGYKSSEILTTSEWIKFLFCPLMTIGSITAMVTVFDSIKNKEQANVLFVIAYSLICINIIIFYLINDILKRELKLREERLFQIKMKNQKDTYYSISESLEKQRRKTHEYKNQLICINSMILNKQYEELTDYVYELSELLGKETDSIDTNNTIVNAIMNIKYQEAQKKGIVFIFKINDLSNLLIKDEDIVVILSNLLTNAIEACDKCEGHKMIKMKFIKTEENVIISVKNTYQQEPIIKDEKYQTTKLSNIEEHGIGINNIIEAIKKYKGSYVIQNKMGIFYFSIVIPI